MEECHRLENDILRQATLELKPEISQFSIVIYDFYLAVQTFYDGIVTEAELRQVIKNNILPRVENYFPDKI